MAIDKIDWHWDFITDEIPEEEHLERAGVHIGYFIEWAYQNGFAPNNSETHDVDAYKKVINSEKNGLQFLIENCDTKFWEEDLNDAGQKFTAFAYDIYLKKFSTIVGHNLYTKNYNLQDRKKVFKFLDDVYANYLDDSQKSSKKTFIEKLFGKK